MIWVVFGLAPLVGGQIPPQIPSEVGLYCLQEEGPLVIEGRAVTVSVPDSHRSSMKVALSFGSGKVVAQIIGKSAGHKVSRTPVFFYRTTPQAEATGAADLVLVKLKIHHTWREFEVSPHSEWKTSSGISLKSQIQFYSTQVEKGLFRLVPAHDLDPGEYGFFKYRGNEVPGLIYDFSIE